MKKKLYKNKYFWLILLVMIYSFLGFFLVPKIIKKELSQITQTELNSTLSTESIKFNPFTFNTIINDLSLTDNQVSWFKASELEVNLGLFKTLTSDVTLSDLNIKEPYFLFQLEQNATGSDLKYPQLKPSEGSADSDFHILVNTIGIEKGSLMFIDDSNGEEIELSIKEIVFNNIDFTTRDKFSEFEIFLRTENDDEIDVKGSINIAQLKSTGTWKLNQFSTTTLFQVLADQNGMLAGLENESGHINANGDFEFDKKSFEKPKVNIESLKLIDFKTKENLTNVPHFAIDELTLSNAKIDPNIPAITIDKITSLAPISRFSIDNNYQLLWNGLNNEQLPSEQSDESNELQLSINQIEIPQLKLISNKQRNDQGLTQEFLIESLNVSDFVLGSDKTFPTKLSFVAPSGGTLTIDSNIIQSPFSMNANTSSKGLNLVDFQQWLPENLNLKLDSGKLDFSQELMLKSEQFNTKGNIEISELVLKDSKDNNVLSMDKLSLLQTDINSKDKLIQLDEIKLTKAEGSLIVEPDGKLNTETLFTTEKEEDNPENNNSDDWIIKIKKVNLDNLNSKIIDKSIQPNYQTEFSEINGSIQGLSSQNTSKAKVDIKGKIDTYSSFEIIGDINPLSDEAYTDLKINLLNINLQNFDSYSQKHVGFPVTRGKADINLDYKLNQNLLIGKNNLVFKQFQLGNKIQNDTAVDLPLKLAIGLLTDRNGEMPINLPVRGQIDDPEFSYGGLVFKAFFKLITGIVASPFKLLGKLVPGGADVDLSGVQNKPGLVSLKAEEFSKLDTLTKILNQRSGLILELTPIINPIEDGKFLKIQKLLKTMDWQDSIDLNNAEFQKKIKSHFKKHNGKDKWQLLTEQNTTENETNQQQLSQDAWNQILDKTDAITEIEFESLAKDRVKEVQKLLIEKHQIPESRIFIKSIVKDDKLEPQIQFGINT